MDFIFIWRILAVFAGLGILFVLIERFNRRNFIKRMQSLFEQEWGVATREDYSERIMRNISYYAKHLETGQMIDDITWNDLEMDEVFRLLNHTRSSAGEEYLYRLLRIPCYTKEELLERERTIQSLETHPELRSKLETALYGIGKYDKISVYEYLNQTKDLKQISVFSHILAAILLTAAIVFLFISPAEAFVILFFVMTGNACFYYKEKAKIGSAVSLFQFILGMIKQCKNLAKISIPGCEEYFRQLDKLSAEFSRFSRFHFLVSGGDSMSGNLFDSLFDYIRILFHVDLIKLATMVREIQKNEKDLIAVYELVGYLDSMLAIASYRYRLGNYAVPELYFSKSGKETRRIKADRLYHPLLSEPVKNNLETETCILLTGSNASGKSTFIKAVAVNAIFAQTIHTVTAERYEAPFFRVFSSMALRDHILSEESYFIVEIKSLNRIFQALNTDGIPVLCFIDEILRGTNTVERIAASAQLLKALGRQNAMCFAATHDIELTYLLEKEFTNYHFEETLRDHDIFFDYQLKKGRADSRNAIRLLEMIGFPKEIVSEAQKRVEYFMKEGKWKETE